jgi:hypothetical protein
LFRFAEETRCSLLVGHEMTFEQFNHTEGRKPRLPQNLSWSVGAERLSELFESVPQASRIQLWFNDHPIDPYSRVRMNNILAVGLPYQIFTVWYSTYGEPKWYFMVYPIDRTKKSEIRKLLETQAFPAVDEWLRGHKTEVWLSSSKYLRCILHPNVPVIEIREDVG